MGKPKAPEPPDPKETSAAATGTGVATSIANAFLGNANQVTPDGNLTYSQGGSYTWKDPYTNKSYTIPRFTATQTLSPTATKIKGQTDASQLNLASLASQQSGFLKNYMSKPFKGIGEFNGSNDATEARLFDLGRKRLDPMFASQRQSMEQDLANKGIGLGSKAYDTSNRQQYEGQNDAYNNLLLTGHGQSFNEGLAQHQNAYQEALTNRNQPINEITALLSGSQVNQPQWANANMPTIPTTDNAGLIQDNFNNKMNIYQQKNAQSQGLLGGLFGLGGKLIGLSDRRTKTDIQKVGKDDRTGLPLYAFRYKGDPKTYPKMVGPMAQDIEKVNPGAVINTNGIKLVDFGKALLGEAA